MSVRRRQLVLSPQARTDFSDILLESRRQWGTSQRVKYKATIDQALNRLSDYPEIGLPRDDVQKGLRALVIEQHVIYYRILETSIRVERILHNRRDALAAFSP